jgi:NADH dehydrogenase
VIVGAGFAGYHTAHTLTRLARGAADVILVNSTDYFLYLPLLPEVAAGVLEPRRICVPLAAALPDVQLVVGEVTGADLDQRRVHYVDPEGRAAELGYHRLVLAPGSVNKLLPIPGVAEYAHGFRGIPEALFLRDHLVRQVELADATEDPAERAVRLTFVVVGAGYTGTEVAAAGQLFTQRLVAQHPRLAGQQSRWLLLDTAERVLPELDERLSASAERVLRDRGVEVAKKTSVREATPTGVALTDGRFVATHSLIWCVGVRPDPVIEGLGLPTQKGRLVVDAHLQVPGRPEVFAVGDAAAVPDLTRAGQVTAMTAQHAERQGRRAAHNIAASYGHGTAHPYRHHDLGFVVDLAGAQAAANPLGVALSGLPAKAVTRGYHLLSIPGNRVRIAADWGLGALLPAQSVRLGLVEPGAVPLDTTSPERPRPRADERVKEPVDGPDR